MTPVDMPAKKPMAITLPDLNLSEAERRLCLEALTRTGSLVEAAELLGTNRHALRRLIAKHGITWWPYAQQQHGWRRPQRATA
jgi:DNA-binding NtrC family response regulator